MPYIKILLVLGFGLVACLPAQAQLPFGSPSSKPTPEVQVQVVGDKVQLDDTGSGTLRIAVQVPPDHHGYLDKGDEGFLIPFTFTFAALEEQGARVVALSRPPGKREDKVRATVLRGKGEFAFRLEGLGGPLPSQGIAPAVLRSQICNDITDICYPPRVTEVPLRLVRATVAGATIPSDVAAPSWEPSAASLTLSERINSLFRRYMDHLPLALLLISAAGLVAAATPCVYPIIPLTAAILAARGGESRRRGRWHALVYFVGMVFFYGLLGLFAATTGTALSAVMTNAWVNVGFAVVFAYLGLSMLGLYEFQFMPALTAKLDSASSRWGGFSGTFGMGLTAGLVVSPCIGPVVGAILLEITGQAATVSVVGASVTMNTIVRGLVLMTGFGVGLGIPFLVIGLLSNRLPQSGTWLTRVKFALGIPILYFAYTYYVKGMETAGVPVNVYHAMLIGPVAIVSAVFIGVFHHLGDQPQGSMLLRRACGVILLVIGVHFLYNGLGHAGFLIAPPARVPSGAATAGSTAVQATSPNGAEQSRFEVKGNLRWFRDFDLAQQLASSEQKPLFIDFYAPWCANCKEFERLALRHERLNNALQQAVLVKIYDTDASFPTFQQDQHFPELGGVGGQPFLPLFAIYSPQGEFVWKGQDYKAVRTMMTELERAKRNSTP